MGSCVLANKGLSLPILLALAGTNQAAHKKRNNKKEGFFEVFLD